MVRGLGCGEDLGFTLSEEGPQGAGPEGTGAGVGRGEGGQGSRGEGEGLRRGRGPRRALR